MARRLKGGMPRIHDDNRCSDAKRLREVYFDLDARYGLSQRDGVTRRVAVMTAQSFVDYQAASRLAAEASQRKASKTQALDASRLRRRQTSYARAFLGGLALLQQMAGAPRANLPAEARVLDSYLEQFHQEQPS